ncbi:hypothetical protein BKA70DRAFT_1103199 [Coprinopsis sp. MPI-PUGE-AT-0042]|nr:hypothetical protein BKA70DRAFT_1103199 [Coprinopsis sp. MPI-PUGE-AT-0042]
MAFSSVFTSPGPSLLLSTPTSTPSSSSTSVYFTPTQTPSKGGFTTNPLADNGLIWGNQNSAGQASSLQQSSPGLAAPFRDASNHLSSPSPATPPPMSSTRQRTRAKGVRYARYQPALSSPLTRQPSDFADVEGHDIMEDDDDDEEDFMGGHEPSSPLGRMTPTFTIGSSSSRRDEDSPIVQRRRAQYKATGPSGLGGGRSLSGGAPRRSSLNASSSSGTVTPSGSTPLFGGFSSGGGEDPHRTLLRERFKQRCFERAAKARDRAVKAKRKSEGFSFDEAMDGTSRGRSALGKADFKGKGRASRDGDSGMDEDADDSEEDDSSIMDDELFRRIMADVNRRTLHSYRVSFQQEVGSSFDPDMEDVSRWEEDLQGTLPSVVQPDSPLKSQVHPLSLSASTIMQASHSDDAPGDFDPAELEDEELDSYAEEYARLMEEHIHGGHQQQAHKQPAQDTLAGLDEIPEEELFGAWNWESEDVQMDM